MDCPVCRIQRVPTSALQVLPCRHTVCIGCLSLIAAQPSMHWRCPMCRHPLSDYLAASSKHRVKQSTHVDIQPDPPVRSAPIHHKSSAPDGFEHIDDQWRIDIPTSFLM